MQICMYPFTAQFLVNIVFQSKVMNFQTKAECVGVGTLFATLVYVFLMEAQYINNYGCS